MLAQLIGEVVGCKGELAFDLNQPDGTPRKLLEVARLSQLGWRARTSLREGLEKTYSWFLDSQRAPAFFKTWGLLSILLHF
jgi:GDP-L-fucose synthase